MSSSPVHRAPRAAVVSLVLASSTGGVGTHVAALARGLLAAGWRVQVCGPPATDDLFGFRRAGADFVAVRITGRAGGPVSVLRLRRATRGSAVVHAHGLRAGSVAALTRRHPLVVTWHNAVLGGGARAAMLGVGERFVARSADITLVASADLGVRARALGGRDVRYAPVAAPVAVPSRTIAAVHAGLGLTPGQHLIVAVGRLHEQKAHDVLISAAARWRDLGVRVVIAGDGPLHARLTAQIDSLQAPVQLLGRRQDVADLLAAADVVVLASRWEARALVAQEALSLGRPLVATAVGDLPALLGAGAQLIEAGDVDALDQAVRQLLADPLRRQQLAAAGQARAATWPVPADTVAQVAAVYRELLG